MNKVYRFKHKINTAHAYTFILIGLVTDESLKVWLSLAPMCLEMYATLSTNANTVTLL